MPVDSSGHWTAPHHAMRSDQAGMAHTLDGFDSHGAKWNVERLHKATESAGHNIQLMKGLSVDYEETAAEAGEKANVSLAKLKETVDKFRSTIGNDLTSIKAASARVQTETITMNKHYTATAALLTTPEFEQAVSNAERLATALEAIHRLQGQKIGFALFSGKEQP